MSECQHKKVTRYAREVLPQTWWEPAEWEEKILCDECDEEFNEAPEGSEMTEEPWEDDAPDWDHNL